MPASSSLDAKAAPCRRAVRHCASDSGVGMVSQCHARAVVCAARPNALCPCAAFRAGAQALGRRRDARARSSRASRRCAFAVRTVCSLRDVAWLRARTTTVKTKAYSWSQVTVQNAPCFKLGSCLQPSRLKKRRRVRGAVHSVRVSHTPLQWILRSMLPQGGFRVLSTWRSSTSQRHSVRTVPAPPSGGNQIHRVLGI